VKALVTGASGFIGRALCRSLIDEGIETTAMTRLGAATLEGVTSVTADLGDEAAVTRCLGDVRADLVFHLAGVTSATRTLDAVVPTFNANLTSTVNLLTAATRIGCRRIVLAGSLEEPDGPSADDVPSSPYAASKWAGSMYARMFWQLYQTPVTVARIFMVYGPQQRDTNKLIPYATRCLLAGEPLRLSSGTRAVDWVFVEDVARGLLALSRADGVDGLSVDLGTGVLTSVREVVERLARLAGRDARLQFGAFPDRPQEQVRCADVARAEQLTGWHALVNLDDGLARTVDSYRVLAKS
jgi:UDP-glucose 4-epimerase